MSNGLSSGRSANGRRKRENLLVAGITMLFITLIVVSAAVGGDFLGRLVGLPGPLAGWLLILFWMVLFLMFVGWRICGRVDGVLIDSRFKMSLSNLQIFLWTILVLSALLAIVVPRAMPGGMYDLTTAGPDVLGQLKKLSPDKDFCFPDAEKAVEPERAAECLPHPVRITLPGELLAALGISAGSFVLNILVKNFKMGQPVEVRQVPEIKAKQGEVEQAAAEKEKAEEEYNKALARLNEAVKKVAQYSAALAAVDPAAAADKERFEALVKSATAERNAASADLDAAAKKKEQAAQAYDSRVRELDALEAQARGASGILQRNTDPSQAEWADLFRGDELGNYRLLDMSKVQMFVITIVVVFSYAAALYGLLGNAVVLKNPLGVDLPALSATMNGLLLISHGGYLTAKAFDHTPKAG